MGGGWWGPRARCLLAGGARGLGVQRGASEVQQTRKATGTTRSKIAAPAGRGPRRPCRSRRQARRRDRRQVPFAPGSGAVSVAGRDQASSSGRLRIRAVSALVASQRFGSSPVSTTQMLIRSLAGWMRRTAGSNGPADAISRLIETHLETEAGAEAGLLAWSRLELSAADENATPATLAPT